MATSTPRIDSGLVSVALIIRSKEGPQFVFHHPPQPTLQPFHGEHLYGTEVDDEGGPEENANYYDSDSDIEDGDYSYFRSLSRQNLRDKSLAAASKKGYHVEPFEGDDHYETSSGEHVVPWEHIFEYSTTDLESILTPSRAFSKKKFELCLHPLYFISYPMHIREDGFWKKRKKSKKNKRSELNEEDPEIEPLSSTLNASESQKKTEPNDHNTDDNISEDGDDHGGMTMFNVVFILNLSRAEAELKIKPIYEYVIKKFNKALKHAQAQGNFVWKESEMILSMKERARESRRPMSWLWNEILLKSTLAAAIRDVYSAVTNNTIATVHLATNPALDLSLQIPIPSFLTSLPTNTERGMPGLLVTAANPFIDQEGNEDPSYLNKHFALLLLDEEEKIMTEIQSDSTELSAPLIECIRLCKPTLSFFQVAQTNSIEVGSLLTLAQHLIYWRRAIAIPPLHGRNCYIVSPNCDTRRLLAASIAWKKIFPLSPTLSNFLATISYAVRPYKSFAPSKNHRPIYMAMLAWLYRGGWVTQIRMFAWIQVFPEIIYEVDYQLRAEAIEKTKKKLAAEVNSSGSNESTDESSAERPDFDAPLTTEQTAENARLERLALKAREEAAAEAAEFAKLPKPVATDEPSTNDGIEHLANIPPYIIKDPHKVSRVESLYLAAIGKRWKDPEAKKNWPRFYKYFNGKEALEMIALKEGMKRKEVWGILMHYNEFLFPCMHW